MISNGTVTPQLIIFDCDGVLIDSEIIASRIEAQVANELGHNISADEICTKYMGMPHRVLWQNIFAEIGKTMPEDFLELQKQRLVKAFAQELKPIDKIAETLANLPMAKCVASSTHKTQLIENLRTTNLLNFFENNVFSVSEVEKPKPHPDVFLFAAKEMGFDTNDCLVIEDSVPGIRAAKAAGMRVFGFLGGSHIRDGHGNSLLENGAELVFESFEDFAALGSGLTN